MFTYILRRVGILFLTLLVVSLIAFSLSKIAPGDPVERIIRGRENVGSSKSDYINYQKIYAETAELLGLDKPTFYFELTTAAYPDTLYRIIDKDHQNTLSKLIGQSGNWEAVEHYYQQLRHLDVLLSDLPPSVDRNARTGMRSDLRDLYVNYEPNAIMARFKRMKADMDKDSALTAEVARPYQQLSEAYAKMVTEATPAKHWFPKIIWNGIDNQYHNWFTNFLVGNFGYSYINGRPVEDKLLDALQWTLIINSIAILLAYLISIPLGVYAGVHKDSTFDKVTTIGLFILFSLPVFWIATLLVVFFTTPEYGIDLFPPLGVTDLPPDAPLWNRMVDIAWHLVLPVFCLTYPALALIARQMRGGVLNVVQLDFIRTARAKGVGKQQVIWKHLFWNALFPIITLIASVLPAALAGSVVIEFIFNIPGMGRLTIDAINQRDWPVVYMVLMLSATLTMIGILIADLLYAAIDPRVSFKKKVA
ncbi:MAG: ABC transporter permease [Bacteroidota bacterium]